jgi:hypothetical protein
VISGAEAADSVRARRERDAVVARRREELTRLLPRADCDGCRPVFRVVFRAVRAEFRRREREREGVWVGMRPTDPQLPE